MHLYRAWSSFAFTKLKGEDDVEAEGQEGLKDLVTNHFSLPVYPMAGTNIEQVLQHVPVSVSQAMNDMLKAEFTREELKKALDGMGDLKAPGLDGMSALFYKRYRIWLVRKLPPHASWEGGALHFVLLSLP